MGLVVGALESYFYNNALFIVSFIIISMQIIEPGTYKPLALPLILPAEKLTLKVYTACRLHSRAWPSPPVSVPQQLCAKPACVMEKDNLTNAV